MSKSPNLELRKVWEQRITDYDYSQEILPPLPCFLPLFAKEFTRLHQTYLPIYKSPTD